MVVLYCRFVDCGKPFESEAGEMPRLCPACERPSHWATDPTAPPVGVDGELVFTETDAIILRVNKISAS